MSIVYSHIKPVRQLKGMILQATQHQTRSTPVEPLANKDLIFEKVGTYLARSAALIRSRRGCLGLSR